MTDKVKYWLDLSNEDINVANLLHAGKKYLYAGFMCHLSVEKALKAKIESIDVAPVKIHNLIRLAEIAGIFDIMDETQIDLISKLNPLQIEARYPAYKAEVENSITAQLSEAFLEQTKGFVKWIEQQL